MKVPIFGGRICLRKMRYLHEVSLRRISISPWFLVSYSSYSDTTEKKFKATPLQERRMIDRFRLHVKGGEGGNGSASLRRGRNDRHGRPDGGNGGRGGDVVLQCSSAVWDFRGLQHHINGKRGGHGASKNKIGSRGEDKIVQVPIGTVIHLVEGEIPSMVENPSSGNANPWDIPGTLISDFHESDQRCISGNHEPSVDQLEDIDHVSSPCTDDTAHSLANRKPYSPVSSIQSSLVPSPHDNSLYCEEESFRNGHKGDNCNMAEDDYDLGMNSSLSEEDDWAEEEDIQYNVAELTAEGQQLVVACGGEGGAGSVSSNRHPKRDTKDMLHGFGRDVNFEHGNDENQPSIRIGLPGSVAVLLLELKSIADVGLVGMPNAGKSTLLGAISRAKPAVGHYAFTTLRPNLGKLNFDELSMTVADIPGLIKGAHENRGLGHAFLQHIERTKILAYVVDLAAAINGRKGTPPWEQLRDLVLELEHYQEGLSDRPSLVVANKIDEVGAEEVFEELERRVQGIPIYPVCAILEEGIPELKAGLRSLANGEDLARLRLENILID